MPELTNARCHSYRSTLWLCFFCCSSVIISNLSFKEISFLISTSLLLCILLIPTKYQEYIYQTSLPYTEILMETPKSCDWESWVRFVLLNWNRKTSHSFNSQRCPIDRSPCILVKLPQGCYFQWKKKNDNCFLILLSNENYIIILIAIQISDRRAKNCRSSAKVLQWTIYAQG